MIMKDWRLTFMSEKMTIFGRRAGGQAGRHAGITDQLFLYGAKMKTMFCWNFLNGDCDKAWFFVL